MRAKITVMFDELLYPRGAYQRWAWKWKVDGQINSVEIKGGRIYEEPPSSIPPLIFPDAGPVNKSDIINFMKQYVEIFDVDVAEGNFTQNRINSETDVLIKLCSMRELSLSALDPKFNTFKRLYWEIKQDGYPQGLTITADRTSIPANLGSEPSCILFFSDIWFDESNELRDFNSQYLANGMIHEVGHVLGLDHHGDIRNNEPNTNKNYYNYNANFLHQDNWGPIMGVPSPFGQWSDGLYPSAYPGDQNDIETIMVSWNLKKRPPFDNYNIQTNFAVPEKLPRLSRIITKEDIIDHPEGGKAIEGMIGHPYDYDILKIILQAGEYSFVIDNGSPSSNKVGIMLDPNMTNLYCECELNKEKENIDISNINAFQDEWPENGIFRKIGFDSNKKHIRFDGRLDNFKYKTLKFDLNLDKTTLVYIKICGDWKEPVDQINIATEVGKGYGQYGSMGRYYLKFEGQEPLGSKTVPFGNAHCEIFDYCSENSQNKKIALLVQDSKDAQVQSPEIGLHTKEFPVNINGQLQNKKFLVYGEPLDINAPEPPGKFFLIVPINGVCKKQEFIVGQALPENLINL
jgi:hypothetical protein